MVRSLTLATLVLAALTGTVAAGPLEDANAANEAGKQLYAARDYQAALAKFREAWALSRQARYMFNLASVLDDMGRNAEAIEAYEVHLAHPDTKPDDATATWAQRRIQELGPKTATIVVTTGRPDATLKVGTREVEGTTGAFRVRVDPGPVPVLVRAGERIESQVVVIRAGDILEIDMTSRLAPPPEPVVTPVVVTPPAPTPVSPAPPPERPIASPIEAPPRAGRSVLLDPLGLALAGSSLVALGVGVYFLQGSLADEGDLDAQPTLAAHDALLDRAHDRRLYAGIGLALAGTLAATAAVRYVWVARDRRSLQVAVSPGASHAMLSLGGTF